MVVPHVLTAPMHPSRQTVLWKCKQPVPSKLNAYCSSHKASGTVDSAAASARDAIASHAAGGQRDLA
jgi:hypothetical protein